LFYECTFAGRLKESTAINRKFNHADN
jgi:hypothetical protein